MVTDDEIRDFMLSIVSFHDTMALVATSFTPEPLTDEERRATLWAIDTLAKVDLPGAPSLVDLASARDKLAIPVPI